MKSRVMNNCSLILLFGIRGDNDRHVPERKSARHIPDQDCGISYDFCFFPKLHECATC